MARKALIVKQQKLARKRQRIYEEMKKAKEEGREYTPPKGWQPTKFYNRCGTSGKSRSFMRDFWVSRQAFRRYAREGIIMGVRKSSW